MNKLIHLGWLCLLGGCTFSQSYPIEWAPVAAVADGRCPDIRGTYHNLGTVVGNAVRSCGNQLPAAGWCDSLTYNLIGPVYGGWGHGELEPWMFSGVATTLELPDNDHLYVVADTSLDQRGTKWLVYSASNGDFRCGPEGLTMKTRMGVSGLESVGSEQRAFNVAIDGSLVMRVQIALTGLAYVVPFHLKDEVWVRWERVGESQPPPASPTP